MHVLDYCCQASLFLGPYSLGIRKHMFSTCETKTPSCHPGHAQSLVTWSWSLSDREAGALRSPKQAGCALNYTRWQISRFPLNMQYFK